MFKSSPFRIFPFIKFPSRLTLKTKEFSRKETNMNPRIRKSRRYSIRALIFAILLCLSVLLLLPVSASPIGDAASDVGDAISDVGGALSDATSDMLKPENGTVNDSDGVMGNQSEEATDTAPVEDEESSMGWIAALIAIAVVAVIVILIAVFMPKRRTDE